jgi:hypothetical protein
MNAPSSSEEENRRFNQALSKVLSVSHKEIGKLKEQPVERSERHKRFSYRPAKVSSSR